MRFRVPASSVTVCTEFAPLSPAPPVSYNLTKAQGKGVKQVNKDRILNAANAMQNGANAGAYHDELEVIIGLIMGASDEAIAAVVHDISTDTMESE